jgi:hypothetical protein
MKKFVIGLLEIYIWVFIIAVIILIFEGEFARKLGLGITDFQLFLLFIFSVPYIFGLIIIQIDNNQQLHNIYNTLKDIKNNKDSHGSTTNNES